MKRFLIPLAGAALLAGLGVAQAQNSGGATSGTGDARQQMQPSTAGATSTGQMRREPGMGGQSMGGQSMGGQSMGSETMSDAPAMPRKAKRRKKSRRH